MTQRINALGPLLGAVLVVTLVPLIHALMGVPPSILESLVVSYAPGVFVLLWITDDAYRRHCTPCYDFGFLMWYLFPLTLLGYLVWTRGWWGLAVFAGLIALVYLPTAVGIAAWIVLSR